MILNILVLKVLHPIYFRGDYYCNKLKKNLKDGDKIRVTGSKSYVYGDITIYFHKTD